MPQASNISTDPQVRPSEAAHSSTPQASFVDVSDSVGLGTSGLASQTKGDRLLIADVNNDGRLDFLYLTQGGPVLAINTGAGFVESKDSGLAFECGKITPAFADLDGDKHPDLLVPQNGCLKLYHNDGKGHFVDITSKSGDLAGLRGNFTSVAICDFNHSGRPDLLIGALKSPNRYLKGSSAGRFVDASDSLGFYQRLFNTRALLAADVNKDGVLDLIMNNEGQEPAVLIGSISRVATTALEAK